MRVIKNRQIVESHWRHLADDEPLTSGDISVSLARWLQEHRQLRGHGGKVGVRLSPEDNVAALVQEHLDELDIIAIEFPAFAEGRGYSQARLLRERSGFIGEIRALGAHRDHLQFMERCGFDAFELRSSDDLEVALCAFEEVTVHYQPAADDEPLIFRRRRVDDGTELKHSG